MLITPCVTPAKTMIYFLFIELKTNVNNTAPTHLPIEYTGLIQPYSTWFICKSSLIFAPEGDNIPEDWDTWTQWIHIVTKITHLTDFFNIGLNSLMESEFSIILK